MLGHLHSRLTMVWAALVLATVVSWTLGADRDISPRATGVAVIVIAFVKIWIVGRNFMELRRAPLLLMITFDLWTSVVAAVMLALFCGV